MLSRDARKTIATGFNISVMNQKQILQKIASLTKDRDAAIEKFNALYRNKPLGYKIRASVVKNQIHGIIGEIAAWEAKLKTK